MKSDGRLPVKAGIESGVRAHGTDTRRTPMLRADLHMTSLSILLGTETYQATNSVTADTNVIGGSAGAVFKAINIVKREPGSRATGGTAGTTFRAVIDPTIH